MLRRDSSRRLQASLPQYQGLATRVSRALVLYETSFRELWEATLSLETATVEAAARHATGEDIRELRENLARNHAAAGNIEREVKLDSEFHAIVARIARNRVLQLAREPAALLFAPTLRIIMQHNIRAGQRNLEAHEKITDALAGNNATEARLWMERHLKDWRQGFVNAGRDLEEPVERTFITESSDLRG
jgi:DNA-binding FadR family transcriptional regulator